MNKRQRRINRILRRAHTRLLGSKREAGPLRVLAANKRREHGLCEHSDEEKFYLSSEEVPGDKSPAVICEECGKPKLRVAIVTDKPTSEIHQLTVEDLLK